MTQDRAGPESGEMPAAQRLSLMFVQVAELRLSSVRNSHAFFGNFLENSHFWWEVPINPFFSCSHTLAAASADGYFRATPLRDLPIRRKRRRLV